MGYLSYVNTKMGSRSSFRFSNGNTLPFCQMPWGMASFVPQTDSGRGNWFYHPDDRSFEGIRLTHQPSPWIGDYGAFLFLAERSEPCFAPEDSWSSFRSEEATLAPDLIDLYLQRYRARMTLTPTERGAFLKLNYDGGDEARLLIKNIVDHGSYQLDLNRNMLIAETKHHNAPVPHNFACYLVMQFDAPILPEKTLVFREGDSRQATEIKGEQCGISICFDASQVTCRMAISFISAEQAVRTLLRETEGDFTSAQKNASDAWEKLLSHIRIENDDEEHKRTFYSCLYRTFLFPHRFYEFDENDRAVHYNFATGEVSNDVLYVDNGFWDTAKTVYPLYSIICPHVLREMIRGYLNFYHDTGWLPKWLSPSETGMMPGTLIDSVIADAACKGLLEQEMAEKLLKAMRKHAQTESDDPRYGRRGIKAYLKYGYLPCDVYTESVSNTLDYAYGDFCISVVARAVGDEKTAAEYEKRAQNYRHLFDRSSGFMRAKGKNGNHPEPFYPYMWGGAYCEGSAWQHSFSVYHDIDGLIELTGGKKSFTQKLDALFSSKPIFQVGSYQCEIHEMSEMAAADFGQCAISNQPSFHLPYLYAAAGDYKKTVYWIDKICRTFSSSDDGYPGDEDNGSMSAWYVFSALGLYPICPGKAEYLKLLPLIKDAVIKTENGEVRLSKLPKEGVITHHSLIGK